MKFCKLLILLISLSSIIMATEAELITKESKGKKVLVIVNGDKQFEYRHHLDLKDIKIVNSGNLYAYSHSYNVIVVDVVKKQIIQRILMPGKISQLKWKDSKTISAAIKFSTIPTPVDYDIFINKDNKHLPFSGTLLGYKQAYFDINALQGKLDFDLHPKKNNTNEKNSSDKSVDSKKIQKHINDLSKFDITNPWVDFAQGVFEFRYGSADKAKEIWSKLANSPKMKWYHQFSMGATLHQYKQHELAKTYHQEAAKKLYRKGGDPRMNLTLIELMIHKGGLGDIIALFCEEKKWQQASDLLEEYYEFSPRAEAFYTATMSFSNQLEKAGEQQLAKLWRERAAQAKAFNLFGGIELGVCFGIAFNIARLGFLGIFVFLIIMLLKSPYLGFIFKNRAFKYRPLDKTILFSIILGILVLLPVYSYVSTAINAVAKAASIPIGGFLRWDHPMTAQWVKRNQESPAKHFYQGLIHQANKEYDKARAEYRQAPQFAQTYNNLALIDIAEGKDAKANYEKALAIDPQSPEANWNLHKKVVGPWVSVHKKYAANQPMLGVADEKIHNQLLFRANLIPRANFSQSLEEGGHSFPWDFWILVVICVGCIALLFCREVPEAPEKLPRTWWLGVFFPGSSSKWGILALVVFMVWCASLQIFGLQMRNPDFLALSDLDAIALPSVVRAYGVSGFDPDISMRRTISYIAWTLTFLLPLINFVLLWTERKSFAGKKVEKSETSQETQE